MKITISEHWNEYLHYFDDKYKDVYFQEEYVYLYETAEEIPFCVVVEGDSNQYMLLPFLRRSFEYNGEVFFDFETPYGYGGPLFNTSDVAFKKAALSLLYQTFQDNNYIAGFVRFHPLMNNYENFDTIGTVILDRKTVAIDLSLPEEDIWMKEIHTKNRNVIKKAGKNGLVFIADYNYEYLPQFINLYNSTMDKLSAAEFYYFDERYYERLKVNLKDSFIGLVKQDDKILSAAIFFYSDQYAHYHLSGSDRNYLALSPNNFMLFEAAKELKKHGAKLFHLGGGTTSSEDDSLFCFKSRFSKSTYQFAIGKLIFNLTTYNEVCDAWANSNPQKVEIYKRHLLKYKY